MVGSLWMLVLVLVGVGRGGGNRGSPITACQWVGWATTATAPHCMPMDGVWDHHCMPPLPHHHRVGTPAHATAWWWVQHHHCMRVVGPPLHAIGVLEVGLPLHATTPGGGHQHCWVGHQHCMHHFSMGWVGWEHHCMPPLQGGGGVTTACLHLITLIFHIHGLI